MKKIKIESPSVKVELDIKFLDNLTAEKIRASLPIRSSVKTWGDEIYFDTGITAPVQDATTEVDIGDIAYWPEGKCLCIFFGKTPISPGDKPVPASEVVIIAKASVDPALLRRVKPGSRILVE